MELYGTASAATTTTLTLTELGAYPSETNRFDLYTLSAVGGTGSGQDRVITALDVSTTKVTFTPSYTTFSTDTIAELWTPPLSATLVNDYINQAIDSVDTEVLQEWSDKTHAYTNGRTNYPIQSDARFIHTVEYMAKPPVVGVGASNLYNYTSINALSSQQRVSQSWVNPATQRIRGVVVWLRKVGTISTAQTLTISIQSNSSGLPSGTSIMSTTYSTDNISSEGRYYYFDFGTTYHHVKDSTYHVVIQASGAIDASNYIAWGATAGTTLSADVYSDGTPAIYNGSSWTAITTGVDQVFHIIADSNDWVELYGHEWNVALDPSNEQLMLLRERGQWLPTTMGTYNAITEGTPIRMIGYQDTSRPSSDTADININREYLESKAMAILLVRLDPALLDTAKYFEAVATKALSEHPVKMILRPNSTRVRW